jgi:hypothetical protein
MGESGIERLADHEAADAVHVGHRQRDEPALDDAGSASG